MLRSIPPRLTRQRRIRRTGWLCVLFAVAINAGLFFTMSLVNRSLEPAIPPAIPDAVEVFAAADRAPPPRPLAPAPRAPEAESAPEETLLEPMAMAPPAVPLVPRMPAIETDLVVPLSPDVIDPAVPPATKPAGPMSFTAVDEPPRRTYAPPIDYPAWAVKANRQATATVEFVVTSEGRVTDLRIRRLDGDDRFRGPILAWTMQWTFTPGIYRGRPVPVRCWKTVQFRLKD